MGGPRWNKKTTVERCFALSVFDLSREGLFRGGQRSWTTSWSTVMADPALMVHFTYTGPTDPHLDLYYEVNRWDQPPEQMSYEVRMKTTPCNFGGKRFWFICPLVTDGLICNRRVGKLYLPPGGRHFGCRHCHDLTYQSCQEHDDRVNKLARDLPRLKACTESGNPATSLLGLKAWIHLYKRLGMW